MFSPTSPRHPPRSQVNPGIAAAIALVLFLATLALLWWIVAILGVSGLPVGFVAFVGAVALAVTTALRRRR